VDLYGYDPLLSEVQQNFGIKAVGNLKELKAIDGLILALNHNAFGWITLEEIKRIMSDNPVLVDVRAYYSQQQAEELGFYYRSL
jgi:UDP-N-acetyl-D-mannosaminuronate dehydrogenase